MLLVVFLVISSLLASCHNDGPNNRSYTASGLAAGTTYYWAVVASDGNGGETPSAVWSYTTQ